MNAPTTSRPDANTPVVLALQLRLGNEPAALPRVLLVFSRRRLRVTSLQYEASPGGGRAAVAQLDVQCRAGAVHDVLSQLRRIVEVEAVSGESKPVAPACT